jgi:hypothetical protein
VAREPVGLSRYGAVTEGDNFFPLFRAILLEIISIRFSGLMIVFPVIR